MPRIPEEIIERIKDATDIVEIVSEYVQLTKRGANYFGLCPFHQEKTPSFSVNPERQIYHCFGCGAGGNVFKFLQEIDQISFVEAVSFLARRCGISLPAQSDASSEKISDLLYRANELAQKYFHHLLYSDPGRAALNYLHTRGLDDDTIKRFGLGYAPAEWDALLKTARKRGLASALMEQAGLALKRRNGKGYYDRFRDRVIFPIHSLSGRPIGFGARALQSDQSPKYINSPETPIYRKSSVLYGLDKTKEAIRHLGCALIVEGYMDLLCLIQQGIENVVASSGTALTEEQCRILNRYTSQVILVFDGDAAGSSAAMRGVEVLLGTGIDVRVVSLPSEHDPDTFIRSEGVGAFQRLIDAPHSVPDYYLNQLGRQHDLSTANGKMQAFAAFKPLFLKIKDPVRRDLLLREVAGALQIDEGAVRQQLQQEARRQRTSHLSRKVFSPSTEDLVKPEKAFVGILLNHPELIAATAEQVDPRIFVDPGCRQILQLLFDNYRTTSQLDLSLLISSVDDEEVARLISACAMQGFDESQVERQWSDHVRYFRKQMLTRQIEQIVQRLQNASESGDDSEIVRLSREQIRLNKELQRLASEQSS